MSNGTLGFAQGGRIPSVSRENPDTAGFSVENLTINNPAPERAGDSLPRTVRKLAYISRGVRPA
jgi:hypothetical protein